MNGSPDKWAHDKNVVVLINPDPVVRKRLLRRSIVIAAAMCGLFALQMQDSPFMRMLRAHDQRARVERLLPRMEELASAGYRDAIIWIATNSPDAEADRLGVLAAGGDGEALFLKAKQLAPTDKEGALHLVAESAAVGYGPAVEYEILQHR